VLAGDQQLGGDGGPLVARGDLAREEPDPLVVEVGLAEDLPQLGRADLGALASVTRWTVFENSTCSRRGRSSPCSASMR